jgi:hypothetical protein
MINLEYKHAVTGAQINETLNTPPEEAYPEEIRQEVERRETSKRRSKTIGLIILTPLVLLIGFSLIVSVFRRTLTPGNRLCQGALYLGGAAALLALSSGWKEEATHPEPEEVARQFYSNVGVSGKPNTFKSYVLLAPVRMEDTSQEALEQTWKQVRDEVVTAVATQEEVTCARCGKTARGLWAVNRWWFKDHFIRDADLLVECPDCDAVYCNHCYIALPHRHECPQCGRKLKELAPGALKTGLRTFMEEPELQWTARVGDVEVQDVTDRVVNLTTEVHWAFKYKRIITSDSMMANNLIDLQERGKVLCRFHNKAVKIGDAWRLLSAIPAAHQTTPATAGEPGGAS